MGRTIHAGILAIVTMIAIAVALLDAAMHDGVGFALCMGAAVTAYWLFVDAVEHV